MRRLNPLIAGVIMAGVIAPLMSSPALAQACLRQNMVLGWKVINDQTLIVTDKVSHQYTVTLQKGCHDLKWPSRLGFSNGTGFGIGCIAHNDFLIVPPNGPDVGQRCMVADVQPYGAPMPGAAAASH